MAKAAAAGATYSLTAVLFATLALFAFFASQPALVAIS
jgi:hypothetical protein